VQVAASFDAFGQRRASHWAGGPSSAELAVIGKTTRAGFTGQEMLDGVGLIHMNGRVYDPAVGRFLSVDPRVRDSAASQSWNGYAYVEARLLSATDPSGWATVDCPQCVVPIEPIVPTVTVTAPRLYPLGTIADFMVMWGGVDTSLQPSRPANEDAKNGETQSQPPPCGAHDSAQPGAALATVSALATVGTAAQDAAQFSDPGRAFNDGAKTIGAMTQGRLALGTLAHSVDWSRLSRGTTYVAIPVAAMQFMNGWQAGGAQRIYATGDVLFGISAVALLGPVAGPLVAAGYSMAGGTEGLARQTMALVGVCAEEGATASP
jgi:RHS repeat-associated protein